MDSIETGQYRLFSQFLVSWKERLSHVPLKGKIDQYNNNQQTLPVMWSYFIVIYQTDHLQCREIWPISCIVGRKNLQTLMRTDWCTVWKMCAPLLWITKSRILSEERRQFAWETPCWPLYVANGQLREVWGNDCWGKVDECSALLCRLARWVRFPQI